MTKIEGSGSKYGSGSISQRHGSADPDPDPSQNVMDPQHWLEITGLKEIARTKKKRPEELTDEANNIDRITSGLEKTRVFFKKTQPSGFFLVFLGFFGFFWVFFWVFLPRREGF